MSKKTQDCLNYGSLSVVIFIIIIFILVLISSINKGINYWEVVRLDDEKYGEAWFAFYMVLWTSASFCIGYYARKKFLAKKEYYKKQTPIIDERIFNIEFKKYYISEKAKMLIPVFISAIPLYLLGYVKDGIKILDIIVVSLLLSCAVLCFILHYRYQRKQ